MSLRFIHTADWQLGRGFDGFPPDAAAALRAARLEAVARIARLATERGAAMVLTAGDVFDSPAVADATLRRALVAMEGFAGPWVLLPGNHDPALAESPWTRLRRLGAPANVVIADRAEVVRIGEAAILPAPLTRRRDAADLTAWFDAADTGDAHWRIGLAHGSVTEFLPEGGEAANPVAHDRAARARLDYLALGDWHGRLRVDARTWYSGAPEPDRFRDNEAGSALLVTLGDGEPEVEALPTGRFRWRREALEVAPGGAAAAEAALAGLTAAPDAVLRLELRGVVDLAARGAVLAAVAAAAARVTHLEADESRLRLEPSDDDLDAIDGSGFVRDALETLRAMLDGPEAEAETARRALAHLHDIDRETG